MKTKIIFVTLLVWGLNVGVALAAGATGGAADPTSSTGLGATEPDCGAVVAGTGSDATDDVAAKEGDKVTSECVADPNAIPPKTCP